MTCSIFTIPRGPSVNALYSNVRGKGRVKTKRYMTWINSAGWELKIQKPDAIAGPVSILLTIPRPLTKDGEWDMRRRDASNFIKAIEDLCVIHRLIEDDSHTTVYETTARWDDSGSIPQGMCRVTIFSVKSAEKAA